MKRLMMIVCLMLTVVTAAVSASYTINHDVQTTEQMIVAFSAELAQEEFTSTEWGKILEHYAAAEAAAAGIFISKYLDRKALKKEGFLGINLPGAEENWYYKHIRMMVAQRIMPRIFNVASLMLKNPDKVVYWGPYLLKTTEEVEQLCKIFQVVCTNGKLDFHDLQFLIIADELKEAFNLVNFGDVNWETMWDNLTNFGGLSKDDLEADFVDIMAAGSAIAGAGGTTLDSLWASASKTGSIFHMKPREILRLGGEYKKFYEDLNSVGKIKDALMAQVETTDSLGVARLFRLDHYNVSQFLSNYIHNIMGDYYRQRWYIYWHESGQDLLASWDPPRDGTNHDHFIINGEGGWYRIETNDRNYRPSQSVLDAAKSTCAAACGWSQAKIDQMNAEQSWYHYEIRYYLQSSYIYRGTDSNGDPNVIAWSFSYSVRVYRSWDGGDTVYEEEFDSYKMTEAAFNQHMQGILEEIKQQDMIDNGYTGDDGIRHSAEEPVHNYRIGKDAKRYYSATDEAKMKGVNSVSFIQNCDGGAKLAEGSTQWKVNKHHPSWEDYKTESMSTSLTNNGDDIAQWRDAINQIDAKIAEINSQISALDSRNSELLSLITNAPDYETTQPYRQEYDENKTKINNLKDERKKLQNDKSNAQAQLANAQADFAGESDSQYRIPAMMHDCAANYHVEWLEDGHWEGSGEGCAFVRKGKIEELSCNCEFRASLHKARGETWVDCWCFSLRTHRSILRIDWELTSNYSSSNVVDVMTFSAGISESEMAAAVNARQQELLDESPDCSIELRYQYGSNEEVEDREDVYHLLWMSDRLRIAREVDNRLVRIHSQLVLLERYLHARQSLLDYLVAPFLDAYRQGMRGTVANESFRRWRQSSHDALNATLTDSLRHRRERPAAPARQAARRGQAVSVESRNSHKDAS